MDVNKIKGSSESTPDGATVVAYTRKRRGMPRKVNKLIQHKELKLNLNKIVDPR